MITIARIRDHDRQNTHYLGLVPSESSSGATTRRGGTPKTGNGHVRRVLTEAAWCYRFPARKTAHLQRRAKTTSDPVQAIAWKREAALRPLSAPDPGRQDQGAGVHRDCP